MLVQKNYEKSIIDTTNKQLSFFINYKNYVTEVLEGSDSFDGLTYSFLFIGKLKVAIYCH